MKVGYLVPVTIIKALPGHESYLTWLTGAGMVAVFPRKYASRQYKVGDSTLATIFWISGARVVVSQKSSQFVRRIVELALTDLIRSWKVVIKQAASLPGAGFAKVAIRSGCGNQVDPIKECLPFLKETKTYTDDTITLVWHSDNIKEYVVRALAPAPADKIKTVHYLRAENQVIVVLHDGESPASFLGKGGANVATAAKLCGVAIEIRGKTVKTTD